MYFVFTCIVLYCISHTNLLTPGKKETINISAGKNLDGWVGHHLDQEEKIKCLIWSSLKIHLESPKSANRELFVKVASFGKLPVIKWYDDD